MATFVNLSNTSKPIRIIANSHRKYENNKQQWLFGVDCCCAAIVVVLRRLENMIFENALPPSEFARCYLNSQYLRGQNGFLLDFECPGFEGPGFGKVIWRGFVPTPRAVDHKNQPDWT